MVTLHVALTHRLRTIALDVALEVGAGTFALVGPSGAGKSSVLRAVSGLLRPDHGCIALDGETWFDSADGTDLPPERRSVGLVFQEYALFPHLSVRANVAYGARSHALADELLTLLGISPLAEARPPALSGGERQRVALARALAREPTVLLLDEPLSALDSQTRGDVRAELHTLLRERALPTLLVTHDFEEAAALSNRVGVLVDGRVLQEDTPENLVARPLDAFVAGFTGSNVLHGNASSGPDGLTEVRLDSGQLVYSTDERRGPVAVAVHPWEISVAREERVDSAVNHLRAPIVSVVPLGPRVRLRIGPVTAEVTARSARILELREGEIAVASFKATAARLLPVA